MEQNLERLILPSSKFLQGASEGNVLQSPVFRIGFKRTISETLDMCAAIRNRRASLASAVHDDLFDRNVIEINRIKMDINANMRCLRDISLKKYLSERISKRRRQKLNRAKRAIDKTNSRLSIIKQTTEINDWVRESANARNEKRKNDEFRSKIDMLLKDVNKRKTEAKRFLFLLDRLCDLRKSREKSAIGRGEAIKSSHQQLFYSSIEKLNSFWKKALHNYTQEKKSLSEKIKNENEVCNVTITDEFQNYRLFSNHWRNVLFGHMDLLPQQSTTPTEFITRRKKWDQYVCVENDGARIPLGWVVPSVLVNGWKKHIEFNHLS